MKKRCLPLGNVIRNANTVKLDITFQVITFPLLMYSYAGRPGGKVHFTGDRSTERE